MEPRCSIQSHAGPQALLCGGDQPSPRAISPLFAACALPKRQTPHALRDHSHGRASAVRSTAAQASQVLIFWQTVGALSALPHAPPAPPALPCPHARLTGLPVAHPSAGASPLLKRNAVPVQPCVVVEDPKNLSRPQHSDRTPILPNNPPSGPDSFLQHAATPICARRMLPPTPAVPVWPLASPLPYLVRTISPSLMAPACPSSI
ncbi:hypothetical protein BU16DRAFT_13810 [Lophium mytilinum]|uniref:Uncharacterized protein n=1 Tax=Lophium mytilinum TaxID=390894 RepID=A0A6A6RFR7_9PEZI|nr:hypothetical protein BU16DRAFT_13810 [Lophium mytilinum]